MSPFRIRTFRGRVFLAILAVVLIPTALAVAGGVLTLQDIGDRSGTLGAWDAVAESGRELLESLEEAGVEDPAVQRAAVEHREALSESVRLSRLYAFVADRFLQMLPLAALMAGLLITGLALLTARWLSRSFARPIHELVGWTERIAREEALPDPAPEGGEAGGVEEFRVLRDALRAMADELEEGRRRAVEAARMRSWTEMARRVAHELKNPLTPMRMATSTLARGREGPEAEAGRILLEEIQRLDEMARTFSQYGKMPEGPRSEVELDELLRGLAEQHGSDAVAIEVETEDEVTVVAHYDALERAFRNLLLNAVEAHEGSADGEVRVRILREGSQAVVRVEDRGPGIPEEILEKLWNPDVTTKRSGTGLGLAIVRQTVAVHDGQVSVANRPDGGASFTVRLPVAEEG